MFELSYIQTHDVWRIAWVTVLVLGRLRAVRLRVESSREGLALPRDCPGGKVESVFWTEQNFKISDISEIHGLQQIQYNHVYI